MLATRTLILTTISKTVVSVADPANPSQPSLNLRPSSEGGQSIPYLRRVLSYPRPSRPPVRLKSVFGYSCCQYGSSKTPHYSYDAI